MKKIFSLWLILVTGLQAANISGYIVDEKTGEAIIGVNILIANTGLGTPPICADFRCPPECTAGLQTLRFSHISYAERELESRLATRRFFWER